MKLLVPVIAVIALAVLGAFMFVGSRDDTPDQTGSETYTLAEVGLHSMEDDCWTVIDGSVYDLTSFISDHPGGEEILRACGGDATTLFHTRTTEDGETVGTGLPHSSSAESLLEGLKIGELAS